MAKKSKPSVEVSEKPAAEPEKAPPKASQSQAVLEHRAKLKKMDEIRNR